VKTTTLATRGEPDKEAHFGVRGELVIEARDIGKRFGRTIALDGLNMSVPRGSVYALLGRNGAGKSTLIQLLMDMLEPSSGELDVLGLDPMRDDVALKQRIGYIPERLPMYEWMSVDQILRFVADIYAHWSKDEETALVARFGLERGKKVSALSRGNRALLSLVIAMAHQPEVVLLDECTSGMDAVARREFDRSVIDALHDTGRTILFASHQLEELERVCDWVGIIHEGRMLVESPADDLKTRVRTLRLSGEGEPVPADFAGAKLLEKRHLGREWAVTIDGGEPADFAAGYRTASGLVVGEVAPMTLEEIFVALAGGPV